VRVRETGRDLYLSQKPIGTDYRCELGTEQFERYPAMVFEVLGEIHRGHPTGTKLSLDNVAVSQRSFEAVQNVGHTATPLGPALSYDLRLERAR
jgi:hypothetical protein